MKRLMTFITLFFVTVSSFADGLLRSSEETYPKDLMKNRMTNVTVNINGLVAETIVYQEFVNEWNNKTNAVYSFPLPADARAIEFLYWHNDTTYKAVLKVREQVTNPGTGEGGIAAEINKYIGRNGIKIELKNILPGDIQKVRIKYISTCEYYQGRCEYKYPLNTGDFIKYPLEHLQFNFNVNSNVKIKDFGIPLYPDFKILRSDTGSIKLELTKSKVYINQDLIFFYETENNKLALDFYSIASDTMDGHFALYVRPQDKAAQDSVLPKRVFFLLSNSSAMMGDFLSQSIASISRCLDLLSPKDYFNIIVYNYNVNSWKTAVVQASAENVNAAKQYLASIASSWGSDMSNGLKECFRQIADKNLNNIILAFSNGRSYFSPREVETLNTNKAAIFPVGIGEDPDRARLEMTASLNYGFVTYIDNSSNINEEMLKLFNKVSQPLLSDVSMEYGRADIYSFSAPKIPSTYAGSYFFLAGRYKNPGQSSLSIGGTTINGTNFYNFRLDFSSDKNQPKFVESIWAKEMIDAMEREVEVYGETPALKDSLITLSLKYGIRCRYTAYIADYETVATDVEKKENILIPESFIAGNYPNPFNPATKIRVYLDNNLVGKVVLLKIYNILGQLVAVIDLTGYSAGWHEVLFNGKDAFGNALPSGIYIVRLETNNSIFSSVKINLIK